MSTAASGYATHSGIHAPTKAEDFDERGQEIARATLLGEWEMAYLALIRERCIADSLDPSTDLGSQLRAHVNRGVVALSARLKDLGDLTGLLPTRIKP